MTKPKKYTISEMDQMRSSIRWSYPSNVSYYEKERAADIEDRLRTYMQNGTTPAELQADANAKMAAEQATQLHWQEMWRAQVAAQPKPKPLLSKQDVLEAWFADCVAEYSGATATAADLYDGFSGHTLKRFANNHAPDGVNLTQADMEKFLAGRGIRSRLAMFAKRYDGVQIIISGSRRSGNYST